MQMSTLSKVLRNPELRDTLSPADRDQIPAVPGGIMAVNEQFLAAATGGDGAPWYVKVANFLRSLVPTVEITVIVTVGEGNTVNVGDNNKPAPAPKPAPDKLPATPAKKP
jgi:mersacidin/lichenicidin family type 2 lantibiotic